MAPFSDEYLYVEVANKVYFWDATFYVIHVFHICNAWWFLSDRVDTWTLKGMLILFHLHAFVAAIKLIMPVKYFPDDIKSVTVK